MRDFDYIIVGAGSAGCVMADRLSEDDSNRVLLVEAGPDDNHWHLSMPAALTYPLRSSRFNWQYETEPQKELNNRRLYWPRGRVMGGSSSINGMVWIRGHPWDFDNWYRQGLNGWAYCQVLPYFRKIECYDQGGDAYRGSEGKVGVIKGSYPNPLFDAYIESGNQAGYPISDDFNGYQFEGVGRFDMNIWEGKRQSASATYLNSARRRKNLTILSRTLVTRLLIQSGKARGIEVNTRAGLEKLECTGEVILCGGAINSPQLLMLSGIGPSTHLKDQGIPVQVDLPGVGENLQDHLNTSVKYACKKPVSLYGVDRFPKNIAVGLQYLLFKTGAGATMHTEAGCFVKSRPDVAVPDIQHHFVPILVYENGRIPADRHGFQCHVCPTRPESRGTIRLRSDNPGDYPLMQPNCMTTDNDLRDMINCVKLTREVFEQSAMDPFRGEELFPGSDVKSDNEIVQYLRESAVTCYHPSGTCKMGVDEMAVVDQDLKCKGVDGLRVVDASVMPEVVSGNTNATIMMMAEKTSDSILNQGPLPPEDAPVHEYQPILSMQIA